MRRTLGEPYVGKRLKLRRLRNILPDLQLSPSTILDAGSEDATFVYWLADTYPDAVVTAVDIDAEAISACQTARPVRYVDRVRFEVGSFDELEACAFDLISAFDVLEHIVDDMEAVRQLSAALRPGGTLLVHVPRDQWTTRSGVVHRVADEDAWRINPGHVRHGYSPERLGQLLAAADLKVMSIDLWVGRWGTLAHSVYSGLEHPAPLRLLSMPVTDLCAVLDRRDPSPDGNTVFARAVKPFK